MFLLLLLVCLADPIRHPARRMHTDQIPETLQTSSGGLNFSAAVDMLLLIFLVSLDLSDASSYCAQDAYGIDEDSGLANFYGE
jgi:hypothetical protein